MEQMKDLDVKEKSASNLVALPTELLVYILSFLTRVSREVAKMRYVSRKFA